MSSDCGKDTIKSIAKKMSFDMGDEVNMNFHYKLCLKEENKEFEDKVKEQAVKNFENIIDNFEGKKDAIKKHTLYCYEYHKRLFLEEFKGVKITKKEQVNIQHDFDEESNVSIDLSKQHPNVLEFFLEARIPDLYGIRLTGFECFNKIKNMQFKNVAKNFFSTIAPNKVSKFDISCTKDGDSVYMEEPYLSKFCKFLSSSVQKHLILKNFKITEKAFNLIIKNCDHLEKVFIYENDVQKDDKDAENEAEPQENSY